MLLLTLTAACAVPLAPAIADPDALDPVTGPVATLYAALIAAMKSGSDVPFATRYAQLAPVVERTFDLPVILKNTVGLRWSALSSDDQTALLDAFRRYTVTTYVANFNKFGGERFNILPNPQSVGQAMVVATQIVPLSGKPARLDYVLRSEPDAGGLTWKVVDILLDGSLSQVAVQRSEFSHLLGDSGAAPLIAALDGKTKSLSGS
jgi:phospholipid transport system substrate-binding protein